MNLLLSVLLSCIPSAIFFALFVWKERPVWICKYFGHKPGPEMLFTSLFSIDVAHKCKRCGQIKFTGEHRPRMPLSKYMREATAEEKKGGYSVVLKIAPTTSSPMPYRGVVPEHSEHVEGFFSSWSINDLRRRYIECIALEQYEQAAFIKREADSRGITLKTE